MATITVSASPIELGFFREQWEAFEADLESAGHQVEIEHPVEERSGRGWLPPPDWPDEATIRIVVRLVEHLAGETTHEVVGAVVAAVALHLKGRLTKGPRRKVVIVDRLGQPLSTVEVEEEAEAISEATARSPEPSQPATERRVKTLYGGSATIRSSVRPVADAVPSHSSHRLQNRLQRSQL